MTTTSSTATTTRRATARRATGRRPWDSVPAALGVDVVASGALGALLLPAALVSERLLGIPGPMSVSVGLFFLAWAAVVAAVARWPHPAAVRAVGLLNLAWVVASVAFWVADPVGLTTLGAVVVLAQAVAVLDLVLLVALAARRSAFLDS